MYRFLVSVSGTEVVIWRDNTIVKLSPEEAAMLRERCNIHSDAVHAELPMDSVNSFVQRIRHALGAKRRCAKLGLNE